MVVVGGNLALNDSWSSSCQNLTIFKRLGPDPTCLDANEIMGRTLMTLFMTLKVLLAFT